MEVILFLCVTDLCKLPLLSWIFMNKSIFGLYDSMHFATKYVQTSYYQKHFSLMNLKQFYLHVLDLTSKSLPFSRRILFKSYRHHHTHFLVCKTRSAIATSSISKTVLVYFICQELNLLPDLLIR